MHLDWAVLIKSPTCKTYTNNSSDNKNIFDFNAIKLALNCIPNECGDIDVNFENWSKTADETTVPLK